jgi:hypothetical protein
MIRVEAWSKQFDGTYDVTVVERGRRYTYTIKSQQRFQDFQNHIRHERYHAAFALLDADAAFQSPPDAEAAQTGRFHPMDGRKRPDPGEGEVSGPAANAGGVYAETGYLIGPDASPLIASADNGSVMLYPD